MSSGAAHPAPHRVAATLTSAAVVVRSASRCSRCCVARRRRRRSAGRMAGVRRADVHQRPHHAEGPRRRSDVHGLRSLCVRSVLLFGPEAGAVTLALDSLVLAWHRRIRRRQGGCFNFGNLTFAVWLSGTLFFRVSGAAPLFGNGGPAAALILPLALLSRHLLRRQHRADCRRDRPRSAAQPASSSVDAHFIRLAPGYAASASLALLLRGRAPAGPLRRDRAAAAAAARLLLHAAVVVRPARGREGTLDKLNTPVSVDGRNAGHRDRRQGRSHARAHPPRAARRRGARARARRQGRRRRSRPSRPRRCCTTPARSRFPSTSSTSPAS